MSDSYVCMTDWLTDVPPSSSTYPRLHTQVRTLSETVRLDARTKLLNPKFYEGMLSTGYEGAREITKRLRNTMGWSATAGEVDNFIYEDANDVFIKDEKMRERLLETNPNALRDMVTTFLEVSLPSHLPFLFYLWLD